MSFASSVPAFATLILHQTWNATSNPLKTKSANLTSRWLTGWSLLAVERAQTISESAPMSKHPFNGLLTSLVPFLLPASRSFDQPTRFALELTFSREPFRRNFAIASLNNVFHCRDDVAVHAALGTLRNDRLK
jgi:hypothetical protein